MRVLLVEDETLQLKMLKRMLHDIRYIGDVSVASNSDDALSLIGEVRFDLVVIDIDLIDMSGTALARKIREIDQNVCIGFISSQSDSAYEAYQVGAIDYVLKPYTQDQIAGMFKKASEAEKKSLTQ